MADVTESSADVPEFSSWAQGFGDGLRIDFACIGNPDQVWYAIEEKVQAAKVRGGIYRVHALQWDAALGQASARLAAIPRLLKSDPYGRLYIGKADVVNDRFTTLRKSLYLKSQSSHGFGAAYHASPAVQQAFSLLGFTLRFVASPRATEQEELVQYRQEFGEMPPFNAMS